MAGTILQPARTRDQDAFSPTARRACLHEFGDEGTLLPEERIDAPTIMRPRPQGKEDAGDLQLDAGKTGAGRRELGGRVWVVGHVGTL
jgi:hypothetical protein